MAKDGVSSDAKRTWSFTLTDLEPLTVPGRSGAGKQRNRSEAQTKVSFPGGARDVSRGSGRLPADSDSAATAIAIPKVRADTNTEDREEPEHESLSQGNLGDPSERARTVNKGQTIADRYVIEDDIAVGGMGRVHRVQHLQLGKEFALKQMHDLFSADETYRAKFYQEARIASGLSHRNIVSIVDFGEDPDVGVFMVMELVEGEPLSRRLRNREKLPLKMACEVILQIADALHYIHKADIVHGDIKPDNILLSRAGRSEMRRWNICLLDFGLARSRQSGAIDEEHIEGTPAYMAPEVICGDPLRPPADIYSLGILAYQLVTGQTPFQGDLEALMTHHLKSTPRPLAEVMGEEVDERLEALIMKALEKDPKERQVSMAAFLFEMKTLMDMLGFKKRRGKKVARQRKADVDDPALRLAKLAFDQSEFALAVVEPGGEVALGNAAFVHFFHQDTGGDGTLTVMDPRFLRIHPDLPADLTLVTESRQPLRRLLTFTSGEEQRVEIVFTLAPLEGESEKLLLSIVPVT